MSLTKYRHPNWYWGKFIVKNSRTKWVDQDGEIYPTKYVNLAEMEIYEESKHGWHNSEEFKKSRIEAFKKQGAKILSAPYTQTQVIQSKNPYDIFVSQSLKNTGEEK